MALPMLNICFYIIRFRCPSLSMGTIVYWWIVCFSPNLFAPSLPLMVAFWVRALRDVLWTNELFTHEMLSPLSREGFALLLQFGKPARLSAWLRRLVTDRGGWVLRQDELDKLARRIFQDGTTWAFEDVVAELQAQQWIRWNVQRPKLCTRGHVMELMGAGLHRKNTHGWSCSGLSPAGCEHDRGHTALHLGVKRYHCRQCNTDVCFHCQMGSQAHNVFFDLSLSTLPFYSFHKVFTTVDKYTDRLESTIELAYWALGLLELVLGPGSAPRANLFYLATLAFTVLLLFINSQVGLHCRFALHALWAVAGTVLLLQNAEPCRRAINAWRATQDFNYIRKLRLQGGLHRWKFFPPDLKREQSLDMDMLPSAVSLVNVGIPSLLFTIRPSTASDVR